MKIANHRLRKTTDIERAYKKGQSIYDSAVGVKVYRRGDAEPMRIAFIVGVKVSKRAVERNRLRRQYRELVRELIVNPKPGVDVLVLVSRPSLELTFAEKRTRIEQILNRAKLL